ncbi:DNA repair ATPase [Streptomyces sp. NBC_01750]|uniref:DNA repair ATPase n=1 Tax=Streptomyces sp. NBC_01750 TaxID=2975928 RepID=UPI002DDA7685|nr:DNA repair ATPase [Streptomyces sp. NBC_01750]WSD33531.1 DNA repair ATPase [Streptomyces sp. NBC_01750]
MATATTVPTAGGMDAGTYEVLRDRLAAQAIELARRAEALNSARIAEFGSTELALTGTERISTETACLPRDIVVVGDKLLFGCSALAALTPRTSVGDVFTLYDRDLNRLAEDAAPGLLDDADFVQEFAALCRYYQGARLTRLRRVEDRLLAVFRTGEKAEDIRVLRWALTPAGEARFMDARGERDHSSLPSHDVTWVETARDDHVLGRHPHISIGAELFVATVGGTLTVKSENDTESGEGIYSEGVDEPLQSLADAEVAYARVGTLILLRVRPYKEDNPRHLVFNALTKSVVRLDGIGRACRRLPDDQGIVFPGGYCLATGAVKTFDAQTAADWEFERAVRSPNGEDVLYAFHSRDEGRSLLLPYNLIRKEVASPLSCRGYDLFDDGTLAVLRAPDSDEPARIHLVQLWRSPYVCDTHAAATPVGSGPLARIGNADLVRGISDCLAIARQATETTPPGELYEALVAVCTRAADQYHWLGDADAGDLRSLLDDVRATAGQVLDEFETVQTLTRQAADALDESAAQIGRLVRRIRGEAPASAEEWIARITELRASQGHLMTLKEMRYADTERIEALAHDVEADIASAAQRAVAFLRREDAFAGYHTEVEQLTADAETIATVAEAGPVAERLEERALGLQTLTEVVAGLNIGDATVRTSILERIAEVLGGANRARATLHGRRRELLDREGRAEFSAEFALLGQSVTGALAAADSPESCDAQLARLLLQLENLESRFADHDDFLTDIAQKRAEVYEAFSARKQTLQDARARRAERLADSALRVLDAIVRRASTVDSLDAVNTYFTSDPMVAKVRHTAEELRTLGDQARAEELDGRLKAARQEAGRALRDRTELFADGGGTIRLGRHRFAVTTQAPELTLVPHGDGLAFALTGTDYRSAVTDPEFTDTRPYWRQPLPSESPEVYRAEYLAARMLAEHGAEALSGGDLPAVVRQAAEAAYDEGYERGVHDDDATAILSVVLRLREDAGLLRYPAAARAAAQLFWAHGTTPSTRETWTRQAISLIRAREMFGSAPALDALGAELGGAMAAFASRMPGTQPYGQGIAAEYLLEELSSGESFATSAAARTLLDKFRRAVGSSPYDEDVRAHLAAQDAAGAHRLVEGWLLSYAASCGENIDPGDLAEAVALEVTPALPRHDVDAPMTAAVGGLLGTHPRITHRTLQLRLDEFLHRTADFADRVAPGFRAYQKLRATLVAAERTRLRLDEYRPRVMSSFVRNRLVDEVYLPLIGDNLAKQLGAAGNGKRTDSSGLLLLVSPPGYGKTTLMEYVADRLGLLLVKVDGPALGRTTTSLDPAEAPDATARQEVEKINFALAAGNNVLLYLDDIQHTSPELLQKFIPLCDATRTLGGHDLRGKRFAVCMAGNPYTESGQRFRIPDMLANRADVWNLGDVLTGKEDVFALSFIENALTSNPVLAPLAGRDRADLDVLVRLAAEDPTVRRDLLAHPYAPAELDRILAVLRHLLTARETVLAVNGAYMASAAQSDATRTEPPFQLQGSYRNLNKIAQRIVPVMNASELAAVIDDHYKGEAQTLTAGAEANLLKLAELRSTLTDKQAARWAEIKSPYARRQALGGPEEDPLTRAVAALGLLADRVAAVESAIVRAADPRHLLSAPHATGHEANPKGSRDRQDGERSGSGPGAARTLPVDR